MFRQLSMWFPVLVFAICFRSVVTLQEKDELRVFLRELQRKTSEELTQEKQWQQTRQSWCHEKLGLLSDQGRQVEGVVESLRESIRHLEHQGNSRENVTVLAEVQEAVNLKVSVQAELGKLRERLHLGGSSSSAVHRFSTALGQHCDLAQRRQEKRLKVLQQRLDLLQSSAEAIDAEAFNAEAPRSQEVSFLQLAQGSKEVPDLMSLFRPHRSATRPPSDDAMGTEALEKPEALPEDDGRPRVLELMAQLHQESTASSSQDAAWCQEEKQRQAGALARAQQAARAFAAAAQGESSEKAALDDQLEQLKQGVQLCQEATQVLKEDVASNATEVALQRQRDRQLAVKVLDKALSPGEEARLGPATRYLRAAHQSFQEDEDSSLASSAAAGLQRGAEMQAALETEAEKLQLHRDFHARRQRRHEELKELYDAQAKSVEAEMKSLEDCGAPHNAWKAEVHALQDAELVFAGEPLVAPVHSRMRGARGKLSAMEAAAEALGISVH